VSPYKRAGLTRDARKDVPGLGEDSDAVLRDLGYRDDEIAKLRKSGVVTS
jgi:crotonobetainyl-CoA:carnitine CoA-transferase CaiB-like acyl-CoA transferase